MKREEYDFGFIEYSNDNIYLVIINEGLEVNEIVANRILISLRNIIEKPSILIIDRRNDYSYTANGMRLLNDSNLPQVVATGIIAYSNTSAVVANNQARFMKQFGRTALNTFPSLNLAISWGLDILEQNNSRLCRASSGSSNRKD